MARLPGTGPRNLQLPALRAARAQARPPEPGFARAPGAVPGPGPAAAPAPVPWLGEPDGFPVRSMPAVMPVVAPADSTVPMSPARPPGPAGNRPAELARCILFSRDVELAQVLAAVAVGAGVQLLPCRDAAQVAEHRDEVILVGQDCVADIDARLAASTLVLTGGEEHQGVLWRAAATCPGARVAVLPQAAAWLGEYLGELGLHAGRAHTTIVAGAGGGAGTSTFAALLAATATLDGHRTLLLDADPHSAGLWPVLRAREPDGLGWEDLQHARGQLSPGQLAEILPLSAGTAVLSWVRNPGCFAPSEALLTEVLAASRRIYERVVVDAGHVTGVPASVAALANSRLLLLSARPGNGAAGTSARLGEQAANWRLVLTGKLAPGTDTRALARRTGVELGGYFAPSRRIERCAADGALMNALAHRPLRRAVSRLGEHSGAAPGTAAGQAA
ncbi:hypothetical protein BLJ79_00705 [Arthrobacter sp. UCD-GKA]|nr:hypothetical protein BLJ79_00705 [Arthrobacter sp. UCD-GKA]